MILFYVAALAGAHPGETPQAFVRRIYAGYAHKSYSPIEHLDAIFAPALAAAIREDERLARGEVGYLDGDPLCDCQDYLKLTARIRDIRRPVTGSAMASVHLTYGTGESKDLRLKLQLTRSGWRVADVASREQPSLLSSLSAANLRARKTSKR